jgi:CxxC-x17-CxxC domain-containing protein
VCSECGVDCQVPFRPSGDKPVLCSDCFRNEGGGRDRGGDRGGNRRDFDKPARRDDFKAPREDHSAKNEVFKEMNTKLDTLISILERAFPKKKVTLPKEEEMVSLPFEEEKPVKAKKAKTVKEEEEAPVKKTRAKKKV